MSGGNQERGGVAQVELGFDQFSAMVAAEACRAEGYTVEFIQMNANGMHPGTAALVPHHLLVREADLEAVAEIIDRSFPLAGHDFGPSDLPMNSRRRRSVGLLVFAVVIIIPLTAALLPLVEGLL